MATQNPWERLRHKASEIVPPIVILKEQAQLLTGASEGVIQGEVSSNSSSNTFVHYFIARVPSMNNYSVTLLQIQHSLTLYPVNVDGPMWRNAAIRCATKDELTAAIVRLLSEGSVQETVSALLAQALNADST